MFLNKVKENLKIEKNQRIILPFLVIFSFLFIAFQHSFYTGVNINLSNILFTASIITFICLFVFGFKGKIRLVMYIICYLFFYLFLLIHIIYFDILDNFFGISEIFYRGEGATQINVIIQSLDLKFLIFFVINTLLFITTVCLLKKWNWNLFKDNKLFIIIVLIISFVLRCGAIISLGDFSKVNNWINYSTPRSSYHKWANRTECINITGLFEYTIRDIYVFIRDRFSFAKAKNIKSIDEYFEGNYREKEVNEYSDIFEDKNLIIIQLETIDSWLVNSKNMPFFTGLMKSGINFTNRYAPSWGGGQTFNTEYSVNTGLYIPVNGYNIYDSAINYYPYSLANLFKDKGYNVNSIHFNQGYFYNRSEMHKTFGYDNHYALMDLGYNYDDVIDDEYLIDNDEIFNMIASDGKFMSYIITYSAHVPYDENVLCDTHYYQELEVKDNNELTCINKLSRISDNFIKKLVNKLDKIEKLDDTVLVFVTDHYAYGYNDEYVKQVKGGSTKDILEKVPFVIWSNDIESKEVDTYLGTSDILPTLANMFNLDYDQNKMIGTDVFSSYHDNYVYFNDYTLVGEGTASKEEITKKVDTNDNIIKSNYYFNK